MENGRKTVGMKEQAKCRDQSKFSLYFDLHRKMALVICFSFCWKQEFKPNEKLIQFFIFICMGNLGKGQLNHTPLCKYVLLLGNFANFSDDQEKQYICCFSDTLIEC